MAIDEDLAAYLERLGSDHEGFRVDAELRLVALGELALPALLGALSHPAVSVRLHAVRALTRLGNPRGLAGVVQALADVERHGAVAIAAERALPSWGEAAVPALLQFLGEAPAAAKPRVVRALGRMGSTAPVAAVRRCLQAQEPMVRLQAALALLRLEGRSALPELEALLDDPDGWVRAGAAEGLLDEGSTRGETTLVALEGDPRAEEGLRGFALELLGRVRALKQA